MNEDSSMRFVILDHVYSEVQDENGNEAQHADEVQEKPPGKECPICKKILPPRANLSFHQMLHPWTEKPYSCDHCLFISMTREDINEHCKTAHPEKRRFVCKVCGRVFTNIRTLNKHKPLHLTNLPFTCAYCDKGFSEYSSWRLHEVGHKTARYQCENCLVRFTTMKALNDHSESEYCKTKILECCEQVFVTRTQYVEHCLEYHREKGKIEFKCEFCDRLYAFKYHLNAHKPHCRLRNKNANSDAISESNLEPNSELPVESMPPRPTGNIAPTQIPVIREPEKPYKCSQCDKEFRTKAWLTQHERKHLGGGFASCQLCNKKYSSYAALYYHRQAKHLQIRRFKCSYCEKAFFSGQALRDHVTSHTGEQPHACMFCPKRFRHRSSKIEHLRIHTGESPYQCQFCDMAFKRRHAKAQHERRHTGEKPFKCRVCDKRFTQDSTWRSHEKKHKPPFTCEHCNLVFTCKDTFVSHKESHVILQEEVSEQPEQEVCYVMEENLPVEMETVEDGAIYVQYQIA